MKIFATSDIHGNKEIMEKIRFITADLIIICGDIGGKYFGMTSLQQLSEYQKKDCEYLSGVLDSLEIQSRFILGNDDWFESSDSNYLTKPEQFGEIALIPFEYVLITPFHTNREVNENKLNYELSNLNANHKSIIVAHTPPLGAGDILYSGAHCGSKSVRSWIEEIQPKIWLCGHIHEDNSVSMIGNTLVFNGACYYTDNKLRGWLIDTDTLDYEEIKI